MLLRTGQAPVPTGAAPRGSILDQYDKLLGSVEPHVRAFLDAVVDGYTALPAPVLVGAHMLLVALWFAYTGVGPRCAAERLFGRLCASGAVSAAVESARTVSPMAGKAAVVVQRTGAVRRAAGHMTKLAAALAAAYLVAGQTVQAAAPSAPAKKAKSSKL